jgi:uncharacterized OsmC-like protein
VRRDHAAREVHEPLVVLLSAVPAPPSGAAGLISSISTFCRSALALCLRNVDFDQDEGNGMTELWVERTGTRRYTGRSTRGAEVLVGGEDVEGVFTPGELMKIALAACSGMASDAPLQRRLGEDYATTIKVSGAADREQERYPLLEERMELDLSGLSDGERARVLTVVERAIDQVCTVGRTLKSGTKVTFEVNDAGVS